MYNDAGEHTLSMVIISFKRFANSPSSIRGSYRILTALNPESERSIATTHTQEARVSVFCG